MIVDFLWVYLTKQLFRLYVQSQLLLFIMKIINFESPTNFQISERTLKVNKLDQFCTHV